MGFRFRRSVKILPGIRLNFGSRGISTSIGVRGAHVTFGRTGTRTTVGLPGTGLSYTHLDRPHRSVSTPMTAQPNSDAEIPQGSARRGFLWIGIIVVILVTVIGRLTTPASPPPMPAPAQTFAPTAAQTAEAERLAQIKTAALGVTQIRHAVANSNTLTFTRVTTTPTGTICYQFHLRNSRGVTYARRAALEDALFKVSGSDGFTALWNNRCADKTAGRNITAEVEASFRR
jgi:hypothetical protein